MSLIDTVRAFFAQQKTIPVPISVRIAEDNRQLSILFDSDLFFDTELSIDVARALSYLAFKGEVTCPCPKDDLAVFTLIYIGEYPCEDVIADRLADILGRAVIVEKDQGGVPHHPAA